MKVRGKHTVQSLYNTPRYNTDFDITKSCCGHHEMVIFLSISLNLFILLEHLAMLLTSTLEINCYLRNFLNKAIGIINFSKPVTGKGMRHAP